MDMTSMPVSGTVYLARHDAYTNEVNDAFGDKRCMLEGAMVCAYNALDDTQVWQSAMVVHIRHGHTYAAWPSSRAL